MVDADIIASDLVGKKIALIHDEWGYPVDNKVSILECTRDHMIIEIICEKDEDADDYEKPLIAPGRHVLLNTGCGTYKENIERWPLNFSSNVYNGHRYYLLDGYHTFKIIPYGTWCSAFF